MQALLLETHAAKQPKFVKTSEVANVALSDIY